MMKKRGIALILVGLLIIVVMPVIAQQVKNYLYVKVEKENLRSAPNETIIAKVFQATEMEVIEEEGKWVKVQITGWIWKESTTPDKPEIVEPKVQKERDFKAEIKEYAKKKWPDDYEMQLYEYNNQMEAFKQITNLPSTPDYNEDILLKAVAKWGEDYTMVIYEYNNQLEAYKKMNQDRKFSSDLIS